MRGRIPDEGEEVDTSVMAAALTLTYTDECVRLRPTVGHDAEATVQVTKAVTEFLKATFRM